MLLTWGNALFSYLNYHGIVGEARRMADPSKHNFSARERNIFIEEL